MSKLLKNFIAKPKARHIAVTLIAKNGLGDWASKQKDAVAAQVAEQGFSASGARICVIRDARGAVSKVFVRISDPLHAEDLAAGVDGIRANFSAAFLKKTSFEIKGLKAKDAEAAFIGWGLAHYAFDRYKSVDQAALPLLWHKDVDKKRVKAYLEAVTLVRDLINIPANDLGPDEMEAAAKDLADAHKAKIRVIKGAKLEKDFPLIHTVGKASPRAPRLLDLTWGKAKDPMLTLVGKGVVFDTGGLDLKPSQYMRLMKKDMGGAAHALAFASLVMALKIPVRLRVLVPCVENAVGGAAFRPGDVIRSRKGLTVENTNTDAEGRLILADALTLGSEEKPDLIIDFATLTGSARAALGQDIPAMFCNDDAIGADLQARSMAAQDPLWQMPLWDDYERHIKSPIADVVNSAGLPGDLIYSALFLQKFLEGSPNWVHLDLFAWESNGKAGRSKGGSEMSLRALLSLIEARYG
ncbi:MAG: leucyl aminopeptidase family protein [Alphaproteobacteria bacterium]